jgi:predicted acetyltransferase
VRLVHRVTQGPLPASDYDLVNDAGEPIGFTQVRHRASHNAYLPPEAANNLYYEIYEAHRGRGYGKALLGLALAEAKRIGLKTARLTVEDDNPTSHRIIESHGAVYLRDFVSTKGVRYHLFEITL